MKRKLDDGRLERDTLETGYMERDIAGGGKSGPAAAANLAGFHCARHAARGPDGGRKVFVRWFRMEGGRSGDGGCVVCADGAT